MQNRPDKTGTHRATFEKNKKKILAQETTCGICGKLVDKRIKYPDPMSPAVDHIVPVAKGGHPSALENLQLAHRGCNLAKSDKLYKEKPQPKVLGNRNLPQSRDWISYSKNGGHGTP